MPSVHDQQAFEQFLNGLDQGTRTAVKVLIRDCRDAGILVMSVDATNNITRYMGAGIVFMLHKDFPQACLFQEKLEETSQLIKQDLKSKCKEARIYIGQDPYAYEVVVVPLVVS